MHGRKTTNAHYSVGFKIFAIIFEKVIFALVLCLELNARDELGGPRMHFLDLFDVRIAN